MPDFKNKTIKQNPKQHTNKKLIQKCDNKKKKVQQMLGTCEKLQFQSVFEVYWKAFAKILGVVNK